jgi:hypothetical protein
MKKIIFTICAIMLAALTGVTAACANTNGDFTIYPSYEHDGNKSWIIRDVSPNRVIEEYLTLENLSDRRLDINLFVREAKEENGKFIAATTPDFKDIGLWISTDALSYTLEPHRKITVPVTISIPAEAEQGQYVAAIFASKKDAAGPALNIVTQIGVRVYLSVVPSSYGFTDIFTAQGYKSSFLTWLSAFGLLASIFHYLITRGETKSYAKQID